MKNIVKLFGIGVSVALAMSEAPEMNGCPALKLHRLVPSHAVLPRNASALLTTGPAWQLSIWVKITDGRPCGIVSPFISLVDTPLGMRVRGCTNSLSGWTCVVSDHLWWDDGQWHFYSLVHDATSGSGPLLYLDGVSVGLSAEWGDGGPDVRPRKPGLGVLRSGNGRVTVGADNRLDKSGGLFALSGLVRDLVIEEIVAQRSTPNSSMLQKHYACGAAGNPDWRPCTISDGPSQYWHWQLYDSLSEMCNGSKSLSWKPNHRGAAAQEPTFVKAVLPKKQSTDDKKPHLEPGAAFYVPIDQWERDSVEIFKSEPAHHLPNARPLMVAYYSSSEDWDTYWELYHKWTVEVLLRATRKRRPVTIRLARCPDPCSLQTIPMPQLSHSSNVDALIVINAHASPRLDLRLFALELRSRMTKGGTERGPGSKLFLLHQNHEQPWVGDGRVDISVSAGGGSASPSDWRNGYPGGIQGLAAAYSHWDGVLRQYNYSPLTKAVATHHRSLQRGALKDSGLLSYVPLGPAWGADQSFEDDKGYSKKIQTTMVKASERRSLCFFAGAEAQFGGTADRAAMLNALQSEVQASHSPLCELHLGSKPSHRDEPATRPLERGLYLDSLRRAIFAPCPSGNNWETFRHWEALASGAIPVSVVPPKDRSYLDHWCNHSVDLAPEIGIHSRAAISAIRKGPSWTAESFRQDGCPLVLLGSWAEFPAFLRKFWDFESGAVVERQAELLNELQQLSGIRAEQIKSRASLAVEGILRGEDTALPSH